VDLPRQGAKRITYQLFAPNCTSRLSSYVGGLSDVARVSLTVRTSIYNNTDTRLHGITYVSRDDNEAYLKQFLVYYKEFGWNTSTFDIDGQCWLEAP